MVRKDAKKWLRAFLPTYRPARIKLGHFCGTQYKAKQQGAAAAL